MELYKGLLERRSVRQYVSGKKISTADMEDILRGAMYAPSAHNAQPWEFIVVDDPKLLQEIMQIHPYCPFLKNAGHAVIVCGNIEEQYDDNYWIVDCSAATENLLLAAYAKGFGACWCGIYPNEKRIADFSDLFALPSSIKPLSLVVLGVAEQEPKQPMDRFNKLKVHYNEF